MYTFCAVDGGRRGFCEAIKASVLLSWARESFFLSSCEKVEVGRSILEAGGGVAGRGSLPSQNISFNLREFGEGRL